MNHEIHFDKNKIKHMPENLRNKKRLVIYDGSNNILFESIYGMIVFIKNTDILE